MARSPAAPDPKPRTRFPYVAALLCAGCVGTAAWTWMRYSYAWDVTPKVIRESRSLLMAVPRGIHDGSYVRLRTRRSEFEGENHGSGVTLHYAVDEVDADMSVMFAVWDRPPASGEEIVVTGRMIPYCDYYPVPSERSGVVAVVEPTHTRLHGASIAGLVVGAMGVFVFTVALEHWLRERRAWRRGTGGG